MNSPKSKSDQSLTFVCEFFQVADSKREEFRKYLEKRECWMRLLKVISILKLRFLKEAVNSGKH